MSKQDYNLEVRGWGPCFHTDEEADIIQDWIDHLCPPRETSLSVHGGQLEDLIWLIGIDYNGNVELVSDQWVGVVVNGSLWKTNNQGRSIYRNRRWSYHIFLESDSFLGGVAGAYAWLKWMQAEIDAGFHNDNFTSEL